MTPEEIKATKELITVSSNETLQCIAMDLLATLEETEQQLGEEKKWRAAEEKVTDECQRELAEAQQTIARQQKVIEWYESGGGTGDLLGGRS